MHAIVLLMTFKAKFRLRKNGHYWDSEFWIAFAISLVVVFVFSGFNRPLWIDEYLHFAIAGVSFDQAFDIMYLTNTDVNHGQTWFYQIASIELLHLFGAGTLGLRSLSWIASLVTLLSAYLLFRTFSVKPILQILFLAGVVLVPTISFELGNSRSYVVLLMSTALSTLALFTTMAPSRVPQHVKLLFTVGVTVGSLNHPYFAATLLTLLAAVFLARRLTFGENVFVTMKLMRFYVGVSLLSFMLSIFVGQLTWMRGSRDFSYMDPFDWLPIGLEIFIGASLLVVIGMIGSLTFYLREYRSRVLSPQLAAGLSLMIAGLSLCLLFSWISFLRNYWILPRQWLPGMLLALFGLILVAAHYLFIKTPASKAPKGKVGQLGTLVVIMLVGIGMGSEMVQIQNNKVYWNELGLKDLEAAYGGPEFYVVAGNLNIKCGDSVWKEHAKFYDPMDNSKFLLTEFTELYLSCNVHGSKNELLPK